MDYRLCRLLQILFHLHPLLFFVHFVVSAPLSLLLFVLPLSRVSGLWNMCNGDSPPGFGAGTGAGRGMRQGADARGRGAGDGGVTSCTKSLPARLRALAVGLGRGFRAGVEIGLGPPLFRPG